MSSKQFVEWVHGEKAEPEPPVSKSQQKREQVQREDSEPKEASPSEPED